ncbi:MAG TPA: hypothetical protein VKB08_08260, partial [Bradyrhizobium sp.]|nr:hypothetical protein [Bradyrhizobium sp.]
MASRISFPPHPPEHTMKSCGAGRRRFLLAAAAALTLVGSMSVAGAEVAGQRSDELSAQQQRAANRRAG